MLAPGLARSSGGGEITVEAHSHLAALEEMLRIAKFDVNVVENVEPVVWGKLIINAAINPLTALLRVKNGDLLASPPARKLMNELANEAALVAKAIKVELPFSEPERAVEEVALRTADNISSMLQDVMRGAPTEVDAINGAVIRVGEQEGVQTPVNRTVCWLVKALPVRDKI